MVIHDFVMVVVKNEIVIGIKLTDVCGVWKAVFAMFHNPPLYHIGINSQVFLELYNKLTLSDVSDIMRYMGDMADLLLEQSIDEWDGMEHWYCSRPKRVLACSFCGKKNLKWHTVKGHWVMFEPNGSRLHTCKGYTPQIEVLKELANTTINFHRIQELDKLYNRMMKAGGFKKIVNIVTNDQLIDLFVRVNRAHNDENYNKFSWDGDYDHSKQLAQIKAELLKRMVKPNATRS